MCIAAFLFLLIAGKIVTWFLACVECRKRDPWIIVFAAGRMDGRGHKSLERDFIERNWIAANRRGRSQTFPPSSKIEWRPEISAILHTPSRDIFIYT